MKSKSDSVGSLRRISIFSADENDTELAADLAALKATYLYADDVQLASVRLYYTLLAMRGHQNRHLRERFSDLEKAVGLADVKDLEQIGLTMIGDFLLDDQTVLTLDELAEGYRQGAFTILNYDDVIKGTANLMLGDWDWLGIPVLDQRSYEGIDSFYKASFQSTVPEARGLVGIPGNRRYPSVAWIANSLLSSVPVLPEAHWDILLEMREYLRPGREPFLDAMQDLADGFDENTPNEIMRSATKWERDVRKKLAEVEEALNETKNLPAWRKFIGNGAATSLLGVGFATANAVPDPHLMAIGGFSLTVAGLFQILTKGANDRCLREERAKSKPYWLLYKATEWKM